MNRRSIRCLDEHLINIIAAGEVVENPASCIKELVENSIDAQSSSIHIEIRGGGFDTIRVMDDGIGMHKEDALLCFERHATSKIYLVDDLKAISTLGFRGEALSSIASISHVFLKTAPKEGLEGTLVEMRGGKCLKVESSMREAGTTFEIYSLFYNVPARLEFQKSIRAATMEVTKMVNKIALCNPNIRFSYTIDDKQEFHFSPTEDCFERIQQILGDDLYEKMVPFDFEEEGVRCYGMIEKGEFGQKTRGQQYFFINKRTASNPLIQSAAYESYQKYFPPKVHPAIVMFLDFPHDLVDVNVHPQKSIVRLKEQKNWFRIVQKAIDRPFFQTTSFFQPSKEEPFFSKSYPVMKTEDFFSFEKQQTPFDIEPSLKKNHFEDKQTLFWNVHGIALIDGYLIANKEGQFVLVDLSALEIALSYIQVKNFDSSIQADYLQRAVRLQDLEELTDQELDEKLRPYGIMARVFSKSALMIEGLAPCIDPERLEELVDFLLKNTHRTDEQRIDFVIERRRKGQFKKDLLIATNGFLEFLKTGENLSQPVYVVLNGENLKKYFLCKG